MWGLHFVRSPAWNGLFGVSPISDLEFLSQVEFVWFNFVWAGHFFVVKWFNNQRGWFAFDSFGFNLTILMVLNATIITPSLEAFVVVDERRPNVPNPYNSKMKRFAMERFRTTGWIRQSTGKQRRLRALRPMQQPEFQSNPFSNVLSKLANQFFHSSWIP
jgi:hypothetical protein